MGKPQKIENRMVMGELYIYISYDSIFYLVVMTNSYVFCDEFLGCGSQKPVPEDETRRFVMGLDGS